MFADQQTCKLLCDVVEVLVHRAEEQDAVVSQQAANLIVGAPMPRTYGEDQPDTRSLAVLISSIDPSFLVVLLHPSP